MTTRSTRPAGQLAEHLGQAPGVTGADLGPSALVPVQHVVQVLVGEGRPAVLEFDAESAPAEQGGLDNAGADPARGSTTSWPGAEELGEMRRASSGQHLARVRVQAGR